MVIGGIICGTSSNLIIPTIQKIAGGNKTLKCQLRKKLAHTGGYISLSVALIGFIFSLLTTHLYGDHKTLIRFNFIEIAAIQWASAAMAVQASILTAFLNEDGSFIKPAFTNQISVLALASGAYFINTTAGSARNLSLAVMIGSAATLLLLRNQVKHRGLLEAKKALVLPEPYALPKEAAAILTASMAFTSFGLFDGLLGSYLESGTIASLAYGQRITIALGGLVVSGIATVMFPQFVKAAVSDHPEEFFSIASRTMRNAAKSLIFVSALAICVSDQLARIVFVGGNISQKEGLSLPAVLPLLLVGMVPMGMSTLSFRAMFAKGKHIAAAKISCLGCLLYCATSGILLIKSQLAIKSFGIAYISAWILMLSLSFNTLFTKKYLASKAKIAFSWLISTLFTACLCVALTHVTMRCLSKTTPQDEFNDVLYCIISLGAFLLIYGLIHIAKRFLRGNTIKS